MKVDFIYGTRPELIKMAIPIKLFRDHSELTVRVISTGQHREMLLALEKWFDIEPDFNLNAMEPNQTLEGLTIRLLSEFHDLYSKWDIPDVIMVQGDTTTAFIAGLVGFYKGCRIAHVEAGLRTFNKLSPWPEEMNRTLLSKLADLHFAPTELNRNNLLREGIKENSIFITGNTVIDALLFSRDKIRDSPSYPLDLEEFYVGQYSSHRVVLITGHRRESFGQGFDSICNAIRELADANEETFFIYPVHMNPNVRKPVDEILGKALQRNVRLIQPLPYQEFVSLMQRSFLILTDSGGVQEEAPGLGIPVLVMRTNTERPEAVESGMVKLVGTETSEIVRNATHLLRDQVAYAKMAKSLNPYGDGKSSQRILEIIKSLV
jgi:UDP-N-acetylglucosamine 2-epimerase (non-hydrolysing)